MVLGINSRLAEDLTASLLAVPPHVISTLHALRRVSEEPPQLEEAAAVCPTPGTRMSTVDPQPLSSGVAGSPNMAPTDLLLTGSSFSTKDIAIAHTVLLK